MDLEGFLQKEICLAVKSSIGEDSSDQVVGLRTLIHQEVQSAIHSVLKRSLRKKIEQVIENQLDSAIMRFSAENSEQSAIYSNENNNLTELENAAKFIASAVADLDENVATQVSALSLRSPINPKVNILHDSAILKQPIIVSFHSK